MDTDTNLATNTVTDTETATETGIVTDTIELGHGHVHCDEHGHGHEHIHRSGQGRRHGPDNDTDVEINNKSEEDMFTDRHCYGHENGHGQKIPGLGGFDPMEQCPTPSGKVPNRVNLELFDILHPWKTNGDGRYIW